MILDNFKRANLRRRMERDLCTLKTERVHSDAKVASVLFLTDEKVPAEDIQLLIEDLDIDRRNVKTIVFKERLDKKTRLRNEISSNDFGLFGALKNKEVQEMLGTPVDLLVNYVQENNYISKLVFDSKAHFKIGLASENNTLYHLMIDVASLNFQSYHGEIKKYLKILNKI